MRVTGTAERMLALLSLLQARRDWPGLLLADRLGVSPRTVRRDVDRLREIGYPIRASRGPDGGYQLDAGEDLPPLLFDEDQAVALTVALQVAVAGGAAIGEGAARALATVRQVLPSRLRHRVDALEIAVRPPGGAVPVDPGVLLALTAAVRAREVLRFDYAGAPDGPRRVEPTHVVTRGGRWYLVGWDLDRADWRLFRADRVTPRTPTGPRFAPRPLPGDGSLDAYLASRFRGATEGTDWPCRGEAVVALPASAVAPYAAGTDTTVEPVDDARCRVSMGAWSWAGLAASLARLDADLGAVGPPPLRDAFAALATRCAAAAVS